MAGEHFVYNLTGRGQASDVAIWMGRLDAVLAQALVLKLTTGDPFGSAGCT